MWLFWAIALLAISRVQCLYGQWNFPFILPIEKNTGVRLAELKNLLSDHEITVDEELATPLRLAKLNYEGKDAPEVGKFVVGSNFFLNASFVLAQSTWYLAINNRQDYESPEQRTYKFQVYVKGKNYFNQRFINLYVTNIKDNPPLLTYSPRPCRILERFVPKNTNCVVSAFYADGIGTKDTLKLKNNNNLFELAKPTSVSNYLRTYNLRLKHPLNFENGSYYFLDFSASDGARNAKELRAIVQTIDTPNRPPLWIKTHVPPKIYENTKYRFKLTAIDGDFGINAPICYDVHLDDDIPIEIDKKTGLLDFGNFDLEKLQKDNFVFEVIAFKCADEKCRSTLSIMFNLLAKKNRVPKITLEPSQIQIRENLYQTIPLHVFQVEDIDLGENGVYSLTLANNSSLEVNEAFGLVPDHGYHFTNVSMFVKNSKYLDFENDTWRKFDLEIIAKGLSHPDYHSTSILNIELLNRNDEWPQFERPAYEVAVNETLGENETIAQIRALDSDIGDTVVHTLLGQNLGIAIDSSTGFITTARNNTFDYEKLHQLTLVIQARDSLITSQSDMIHTIHTFLNIQVLDVNDETPVLKVPKFIIRLQENMTFEWLTNEIVAEDLDSNAMLTAEILWQESVTTKNGHLVALDGFEHSMYLKSLNRTINKIQYGLFVEEGFEHIMDYESVDQIVLTLKVVDLMQELNADSAAVEITIEIEDVNDNPPEFVDGTLNQKLDVNEWAEVGSIIGSFETWDRDGPGNNNVTYKIIPLGHSNALSAIAIDELSGVLTVVGKVECDVPKVYELGYQVVITDQVFKVVGQFHISITDINNKSPQLYNDTQEVVEISENSRTRTFIGVIKAFDLDRDPPHNTLEYSICTNCTDPSILNLFVIDPSSGILTVQLGNGFQLDRDNGTTQYQIPINIHDNYNLSMENRSNSNLLRTSVTVKLLDENDNAPQLPDAHMFRPELSEADDICTYSTAVLTAVDIDEPNSNNSLLAYKLLSIKPAGQNAPNVDAYENIVSISNEPLHVGRLRVEKSLSGFYGSWTLHIEAYDHGEPQLKSSAFYELNVLPKNFDALNISFPKANTILNVCYTRLEVLSLLYEPDCETPLRNFSANVTSEVEDVEFRLDDASSKHFALTQINRTDAHLMVKDIAVTPGNIYKLNVHAGIRNKLDVNIENVQIIFVGELVD